MWIVLGILAAALMTLLCSTLTFALRSFSRARLESCLDRAGSKHLLEPTVAQTEDLIHLTAAGRLFFNVLIVIQVWYVFDHTVLHPWARYLLTVLLAGVIGLVFSVSVPTALARYVGEPALALFLRPLHAVRAVMSPLTWLMRKIDAVIKRLVAPRYDVEPDLIEKDILTAVQEGEKEGVMDTTERQMIESVIEFRNTEVGQTMTSRPEIVAIEISADLGEVKRVVEESGHSRVPIYDGNLDHIVGVLYARDLLRHLGQSAAQFDLRSAMRPAVFVPETKLLRDLLKEFRDNKVHMAIVLDEYGGTAGLVTIEDILEELVGEISDEHEPRGEAMLKKLDNASYEVDARMYVTDLNHRLNLQLPEDAGYDTIGGLVSTTLGRIPQVGSVLDQAGIRYTVIDAEPQRIKRLKLEFLAGKLSVLEKANR